uniref:Adenylate kinase 7b n=1 Tax=Sinocyclocheilus anshuiensis TaxID=1608454 RepID=A0A671MFV1_9TELE
MFENVSFLRAVFFLGSCVVGASLVDPGEADVEEEDDRLHNEQPKLKNATFQIVGTYSVNKSQLQDYALDMRFFPFPPHQNLKREDLFCHLMKCDVIIYDITPHADQIDEAQWAVSALHDEMDQFSGPKMFILVSTIMKWAMTKPDDPEIPFTEEHYSRRKAHPNFHDHIGLEKLVVKFGKNILIIFFSTYVVASGLQYGMGEHIFHLFFKMSWLGEVPQVPTFGNGSNIIPTIHINDLAGIIQNVIDHKPKSQYFVAVDDSKNTMEDIIKVRFYTFITLVLGPGETLNVSKEELYLIWDLTVRINDIDSVLVNFCIEATYLKENFNIQWVSETGMVENIEQITEEYKQTRGLLPLRICILGPPAVGKSTIAERICKHYKLHHVKLKQTITETLENLVSKKNHTGLEQHEGDEAQEFLDTLKDNMNQNGGWLDDQSVIRIMRDKLRTKPCVNQGFVLDDGFPKTYEQAKELFTGEKCVALNIAMILVKQSSVFSSEFVFFVDATDVFLKNHVLNLPETVVEETSYTPEQFLRRLAKFRERNVENETNDDNEYLLIIEKIRKKVGKPKNYGMILEEVEEEEQRQAEQQLKEQAAQRAEAEQNYLMRDVMPTLIQGLIECCGIRPDDPINFLAEYLLKNNPEV